jgi:hypothetical protein
MNLPTVNVLAETQNASRYFAMYLIQDNISHESYIGASPIAEKIKTYVTSGKKEARTEQIKEEMKENNEESNLNDLLVTVTNHDNIKCWDDIMKVYVLLYTVSKLSAEYDSRVLYVEKCIDACSSQSITNWIILHGGWNKFLNVPKAKCVFVNKFNYKLISSLSIGFATLFAIGYLFKKSTYKKIN